MMDYSELLRALDFDQTTVDAFEGKIRVPRFTLNSPFNPRFGFPPILIPIWSNGDWPGYIAAVTNWFGGHDVGFVQHFSEEQSSSEIALNVQQLKTWMTYEFLREVPDIEEVGRFAQSIGLCRSSEVEAYFMGCRAPRDLRNLDVFKGELPQVLVGGTNDAEPKWQRIRMSDSEILQAIDSEEHLTAWHAMNAPGRSPSEIDRLLERIQPFAGDPRFEILIECWRRAVL